MKSICQTWSMTLTLSNPALCGERHPLQIVAEGDGPPGQLKFEMCSRASLHPPISRSGR